MVQSVLRAWVVDSFYSIGGINIHYEFDSCLSSKYTEKNCQHSMICVMRIWKQYLQFIQWQIIIIGDVGRVFCIKISIEFLASLLYLLNMCWASGCLVAISISYMYWLWSKCLVVCAIIIFMVAVVGLLVSLSPLQWLLLP